MNRYKLIYCVILLLGSGSVFADFWHEKGFSDGIHGLKMKNVAAIEGASQQAITDYQASYFEGLNQYCQTETAEQLGKSGEIYNGICKYTDQSWTFQAAYQKASTDSADQRNRERWVKLSKTRWY